MATICGHRKYKMSFLLFTATHLASCDLSRLLENWPNFPDHLEAVRGKPSCFGLITQLIICKQQDGFIPTFGFAMMNHKIHNNSGQESSHVEMEIRKVIKMLIWGFLVHLLSKV